MKALIQPAEVKRDECGYWTHPGIPDFNEDHQAYKDWLAAQGLETDFSRLEDEDLAHPAYVNYFENDGNDISTWNPEPPKGDGWFVLWIEDTEDSPYYVWARRANQPVGSKSE